MNIVPEVLRKLSYLKPNEFYNDKILEYFLKTSLKDYFDINDNYEITINIKNNYLELTNLTTNEEYLIEKKENSLDFINKKTNEILFHIRNNAETVSLVNKNNIKNIKLSEDNEIYSIINNADGNILTLSELKVKISNKDYFELRNKQLKSKIVGLSLTDDDKYEQIFTYLDNKVNQEKKGVRKRILNLF